MRLITLVCLFFISSNLFANDLRFAPPTFVKDGRKFVFIDITEARYKIKYDIQNEVASATTTLYFTMPDTGFAIFDTRTAISEVIISAPGLASLKTSVANISLPDRATSALYFNTLLSPGVYSVVIKSEIERLVSFNRTYVRSGFWMSDLSDRGFLEKYLPANLDYDHVPMFFDVEVVGTETFHNLVINCPNQMIAKNHWTATCPDYYTSSFVFYHLFDETSKKFRIYNYKTIDNRVIPVTVYSNSTDPDSVIPKILENFAEFETDFGPWPHNQFIAYISGSGGMEYAGATMTSTWALSHEMHHSYFARGMGPAGGNAGWIDEALASWRDDGYPRTGYPNPTNMAGKSPYVRLTDRRAYSDGARFIAKLNFINQAKGGMMSFLKDFTSKRMYQSITTPMFQGDLEKFFNKNFSDIFKQYIYGQNGNSNIGWSLKGEVPRSTRDKHEVSENPYHPKVSDKELRELL